MELVMRKAQPQDLDGLDQVMLVISDAAGERGKVLQLLEHITADPQKYLLVAEDKDTGTICGSLFGVVFEGICDSCGGKLIQRKDDTPGTVRERLKVYHKGTGPLVDFYAERGLLKSVEVADNKEATNAKILAALGLK